MYRKRQLNHQTSETPSATWKVKPPGPEQLELERLFKSNEISPSSTADSVRKSNNMFQRFSASVFGNHFRSTKAKLGGCARVSKSSNSADNSGGIPELGQYAEDIPGRSSESPTFEPQFPSSIQHVNTPYWVWKFFDHEKDLEFICVAVVAFSGIRNVDFEIAPDGMTVYVHYTWPTAIYKFKELFSKSENDDKTPLTMNHPKVHAFVANCLDNGVSQNSMPKGQIVIELPEKIQRLPSTYKTEAACVGGTNIIQVTFSAEPRAVVIETADRSIVFK